MTRSIWPHRQVARIPPQYPLKFLRRQPAPEASLGVLFGTFDKRPAEALVQAGATLLTGGRASRLGHHAGRQASQAVVEGGIGSDDWMCAPGLATFLQSIRTNAIAKATNRLSRAASATTERSVESP